MLLLVVAVLMFGVGSFLFGRNYEIRKLYPAGELGVKPLGIPCTILWASYYRPCNVRLALALSRIGLEDHTVVLLSSDPEPRIMRIDAKKTTCAFRTVDHIGNEETMIYFDDGSLWFLPKQYRDIGKSSRTTLNIVVGNSVSVCSDGGVALIQNAAGNRFIATLVEAHHDKIVK